MSEPTVDLDTLFAFVQNILRSSEDVKNILSTQCDEARYVLSPWPITTIEMKRVDPNSCTCNQINANLHKKKHFLRFLDGVSELKKQKQNDTINSTSELNSTDRNTSKTMITSSEDRINEIANDINIAINQAQQLREKLSRKVLKAKPSVEEIYAPRQKASLKNPKLVSSDPNLGINEIEKNVDAVQVDKENGGANRQIKPSTSTVAETVLQKNSGVSARSSNSKTCLTKSSVNIAKARKISSDMNEPRQGMEKKSGPTRKSTLTENRRSASKTSRSGGTGSSKDKKLTKTSPYNTSVAVSKLSKNFIAQNKLNVKQHRSSIPAKLSKSQKSLPNLNRCYESSAPLQVEEATSSTTTVTSSLKMLNSCTASIVDLENLARGNRLRSEESPVECFEESKSEINNCLVHGKHGTRYTERKMVSNIDVVEGLDRFGVPPDLLKILKVYHAYLSNSQTSEKLHGKRREKSVNQFLTNFYTMNESQQEKNNPNPIVDLYRQLIPLFKESCSTNMDADKLESTCKMLKLKNVDPTEKKRTSGIPTTDDRMNYCERWRLNAVWNEMCTPKLKELNQVSCTRYHDKNQLLALADTVQRLQRLSYQENLNNLLISDVLSAVRNSLEPTSKEYIKACKTAFMIADTLMRKVLVLVRTDR